MMRWLVLYAAVGCLVGALAALLQAVVPLRGARWWHPLTNAALWPCALLLGVVAFVRRTRELDEGDA